jgi:hypothetical protein
LSRNPERGSVLFRVFLQCFSSFGHDLFPGGAQFASICPTEKDFLDFNTAQPQTLAKIRYAHPNPFQSVIKYFSKPMIMPAVHSTGRIGNTIVCDTPPRQYHLIDFPKWASPLRSGPT